MFVAVVVHVFFLAAVPDQQNNLLQTERSGLPVSYFDLVGD